MMHKEMVAMRKDKIISRLFRDLEDTRVREIKQLNNFINNKISNIKQLQKQLIELNNYTVALIHEVASDYELNMDQVKELL